MSEQLTYSKYLKLRQLLDLQEPIADPPQHDEMLFIVVHQVYELWFRVLLHELERVRGDFTAGNTYYCITTFKRMRMIMKTLVQQVDVLETMNGMSFAGFRDHLQTASGFQSVQFRELEFLLGYKRRSVLEQFGEKSHWRNVLERRLAERSLIDHFYDFLALQDVDIPEAIRERDVTHANEPSAAIQEQLVEIFRSRRDVRILLEYMTDFDQGLQEWRYRHVKMVERTIGDRFGTGGSPGAEFLRATLFKPVFPDLWAIRSRL